MKRLLLGVFLLSAVLSGCKKESESDCAKNHTVQITVYNNESDPYNLFVWNDYHGVVKAGGSITVDVYPGQVPVKLVQASGYLFYATEYTWSQSLNECEKINIYFP